MDDPERKTLDWPSPRAGDLPTPATYRMEPPPGERGLFRTGLARPVDEKRFAVGDLVGVEASATGGGGGDAAAAATGAAVLAGDFDAESADAAGATLRGENFAISFPERAADIFRSTRRRGC